MPRDVSSFSPRTWVVDTAADLPRILRSATPGDIATTRTNDGYILDWIPGAAPFWRQFASGGGGGGPGALMLYVVAQVGTPMAVTGTFPTHDAAAAQALLDFGVTPLKADFITMPGTYPGLRLRPGMHVSLVVVGGTRPGQIPPDPTLNDTPPFIITGPVDVLAADGWNVVPGVGVPIPNASLSGAVIDATAAGAAGRCLRIGAGVTAGTVTLPKCVLKVQSGTAAIAIDEVAPGPLNPVALTVQLETSQIEAFGATAFNGVNVRLTGLGGCRIQGAMSTSQEEGITLFDSFGVFAPITANALVAPAFGSANVRIVRTSLLSIGSPVVTLNGAPTVSFSAGCDVNTFGSAPTFGGTGGTVWLQSGSLPGFVGANPAITFLVNPPGQSSCTPPTGTPDLNADGYIAPVGAGAFTYTIPDDTGIDLILFDFSGLIAGATVTINLPNARLAMPWTPLVLKRIDENLLPIVRVNTTAGNEFDKSTVPLTNIPFPPGDCIRLTASREPVAGIGRWLTTP